MVLNIQFLLHHQLGSRGGTGKMESSLLVNQLLMLCICKEIMPLAMMRYAVFWPPGAPAAATRQEANIFLQRENKTLCKVSPDAY